MTLMFSCHRCAWRGPSLWELLAHPCGAVPVPDAETPEPPAAVASLPAAIPPEPPRMFNCAQCGHEVTAVDFRRRKFCSHTCRVRFHNANQYARQTQREKEPHTIIPPNVIVTAVNQHAPRGKVSPAKRSRRESLFGAKPVELAMSRTAATSDEFEPERLPDTGSAPTTGESTPNPSHPVRSHIVAPTWRQVTPSAPARYCVCGMQLPVKLPEHCESCGRAIQK